MNTLIGFLGFLWRVRNEGGFLVLDDLSDLISKRERERERDGFVIRAFCDAKTGMRIFSRFF